MAVSENHFVVDLTLGSGHSFEPSDQGRLGWVLGHVEGDESFEPRLFVGILPSTEEIDGFSDFFPSANGVHVERPVAVGDFAIDFVGLLFSEQLWRCGNGWQSGVAPLVVGTDADAVFIECDHTVADGEPDSTGSGVHGPQARE